MGINRKEFDKYVDMVVIRSEFKQLTKGMNKEKTENLICRIKAAEKVKHALTRRLFAITMFQLQAKEEINKRYGEKIKNGNKRKKTSRRKN